ncbi:adenylate cyclase type 9 [Diachasma alloeum]|uniref:adenylate cyclase type 9 n=1 Tax=Diachasma alloeum TaxID=454923 RepID=UPI0007384871|nr:adenylate cyclase type 9 [Diachasma alloeum]
MIQEVEKERNSSVCFIPGHQDDNEDGNDNERDEIHMSLAPYIQTYLAHSGQGVGCCGIGLPVPFERAAPRSWWNPKFDSEILEEQYKTSAFLQLKLRFRYALLYVLLICLSWLIYFMTLGIKTSTSLWPTIVSIFTTIFVLMFCVFYWTSRDYYRRYIFPTSLVVSTILCASSLLLLVLLPPYGATENEGLSLVGHFSLCSEIQLLIYTVIPMPLYACFGVCTTYSIIFEFLTAYLYHQHQKSTNNDPIEFNSTLLAIRILTQLCIHIIGVHILIMTFVRMRGTFMKVGQSLLVRRQLEMEKQLKEKMIHSVMPPKVADWLMEESERERERENSIKKGSIPSNNADLRSLFRPFNMHSMEDVSILFADIVGFTRMSSNKTAEELVGILNDLFERFDELCQQNGCEKISTLGDCYYCVSGCPKPRLDHAKCCVDMGLAMIEAINQFDIERREGVNMRVGVHTGTVLCGIVGTKRFKFDVWSNDVTLANKLESTGIAGRVHLSEKTLSFLGDQYLTEEGETVKGVKTFFIKGRKSDIINNFMNNIGPISTSISPILHARQRVSSCNDQSKPRQHYLHMLTNANNYRIKANSLPSILDCEADEFNEDVEGREFEKDVSQSPSSTASCGKKKKSKPWKYLQRQRTTEEMTPLKSEVNKTIQTQKNKSQVINMEDENNVKNGAPVNNLVEMNPNPRSISPLSNHEQAPLSHASSVCSRKDSGIRSNSRRSSIQQQLFLMNGLAQGDLLGQRVSGYYTSSSTLNSREDPSSSGAPSYPPYPFPPAVTDTFGACFHKLRKQSDLQLIRCVQDNVSSQRSYFVKPPLSRVTLFFKNKEMEEEYRENAHKTSESVGDNPPTLATSRFNTYFDILVSALVYTAITASLLILCKPTIYFVIFCAIATVIQVFVVTRCIRQLVNPNSAYAIATQKIFKFFTKWYPWHCCGALLVSLPIISIFMNLNCRNGFESSLTNHIDYYYCYLIFVGFVHFCNFTQLNCWMKNFLVTFTAVLFVIFMVSNVGSTDIDTMKPQNALNSSDILEPMDLTLKFPETLNNSFINVSRTIISTNSIDKKHKLQYNDGFYDKEIFLDIILLLILVWFLNREFEISYRLSFHGNAVAARDKSRVQSMKNQADWLLHNIIPKYVADQLKTTAKYSQNHKAVGIIFASIVNFNELYDESYLGGKEYLRVLNELIGDFDELLEKNEFSNVEKIKTIGSTFMAASGLNPQVRNQSSHTFQHLFQLLDFAVAMHKVIYDFNRDLLGFRLILRVGFNFGDVTAGVIGATKLYYDIWGDAVNIASRMDSTGVAGRIQLTSNCLEALEERYEFEPRGQVYVKGKDNMDVYLLIGKKE